MTFSSGVGGLAARALCAFQALLACCKVLGGGCWYRRHPCSVCLAASEGHSYHAAGLALLLPPPIQRAPARWAGQQCCVRAVRSCSTNMFSARSRGRQLGTEQVPPCAAGLVLASLLPMPEARQLGVDAAQADSQSADDEAGSPQMQLGHEDALAARWGG